MAHTPFLMYHELERPGRPLCSIDPGYVTYVLPESVFARQLAWLHEHGLKGVSVSDAHASGFDASGRVAITFDDGCESDWIVAAPLLSQRGFGGTFYVVSTWVGRRRGYATVEQLRQLAAAGFEIGSHSATHAMLTDVSPAGLRREIAESKRALEDMLGLPIRHFSCPGGRWTRRAALVARDAGYDTMATSRVGSNDARTGLFALRRCALQRHQPHALFETFCSGTGLWRAVARDRVLAGAKALLGTRLYAGLRSRALGGPESGSDAVPGETAAR